MPRESVAIIIRGHERGALRSDGLRLALVSLLGLVGPRSRVFVRSWAHSDAPVGSTWRTSSVEPRIRSSLALEPRRPLSRAQLCSYFERGLLGARLASCELEDEMPGQPGKYSSSRARVWSAPVVGQQRMWAQQLRALDALDAYVGSAFTAAVSLRIDLFSRSFAISNGYAFTTFAGPDASSDRGRARARRLGDATGVSGGSPAFVPSVVAEGIAGQLARRNSSLCVHALGGCARAITLPITNPHR